MLGIYFEKYNRYINLEDVREVTLTHYYEEHAVHIKYKDDQTLSISFGYYLEDQKDANAVLHKILAVLLPQIKEIL